MVSVVILSYNTREITLKCLEFLLQSRGVELEVVVVDNNSSDGSAEAIGKKFPQVRVVKNKNNVGFARGNNQAIIQAKGEWVLLLNSDAFVYQESILEMMTWAEANPQADVVGPHIQNPDGTNQQSWGFFPTLGRVALTMLLIDNLPVIRELIDAIHVRAENRYAAPVKVDWVTGSAVMVKAEVIKQVGGIDENYFMYGEEMEWMYRITKAGYQVWYTPAADVVHIGRASSADQSGALIGEMRGWQYFWIKHLPKWQKKPLLGLILIGCGLRQILKPKLREIYKKAMAEFWDQISDRSRKSETAVSL